MVGCLLPNFYELHSFFQSLFLLEEHYRLALSLSLLTLSMMFSIESSSLLLISRVITSLSFIAILAPLAFLPFESNWRPLIETGLLNYW